jgi:hypothetical protein
MNAAITLPNTQPPDCPVFRASDVRAAEAFDDEAFFTNMTVDEAAAISSPAGRVHGEPWAQAS